MKNVNIILVTVINCCLLSLLHGQNTVGLTHYGIGNTYGYVLFTPMTSTKTFLIDKCGEKIHEWNTSTYKPALSAFLLEDGSLLRTGQLNNAGFDEGGSGGIIEKFDWNGALIWSYTISDSNQCMHHDIRPLPNGNILCIVWDRRTRQDAISNGKDSSYTTPYLWSEKLIELKPIGFDSAAVVWEWKLWDHLIQDFDNSKLNFGVVANHPELVNINYFPGAGNTPDWIHLNSIDYNPQLNQVLVSSHTFSEVWIIDHSTTSAEASMHTGGNSGKGGDILYRWGNPQAYKRGNPSTKVFYGQHHATWIPQGYVNEGKILVFNNGLNRPGSYSSVDMIAPAINAVNMYDVPGSTAFLPTGLFWSYTANTASDFYSSNISGVYPLKNGSFMVTSGTKGLFFEIDSSQQLLWSYINPVANNSILTQGNAPSANLVFRCNFYESSYPGLAGHTLAPMGEIELNPTVPSLCDNLPNAIGTFSNGGNVTVYPNPFGSQLILQCYNNSDVTVVLRNMQGQTILQQVFTNSAMINTSQLVNGIYFYELHTTEGLLKAGKVVKQ